MNTDVLRYETRGSVAVVTLDDPPTRNALSGEELFAAFENVVDRTNEDAAIGALVLTGSDPAFSSGGNIVEMQERRGMFAGSQADIATQYRHGIQRIPLALDRLRVPSIAAVNGPAIGAGCGLACMCDIRIASERAKFAVSFIKLGLIPGDGSTWLLPRIIGYGRAAELALTGDPIDAAKALQLGLVSRVVEHGSLMVEALALAERIANNPRQALRWTKRLLRESLHLDLPAVLAEAATLQSHAHHSPEHAAALAAIATTRSRRP